MSSGRAVAISLHERGGGQGAAALLDSGMFEVRAQIAVHDRAGAADHAMGPRAPARFYPAAPRRNPLAMRQRRETVEHPFGTIKARIGRDTLPDQDALQGRRGDGAQRSRP